MGRKKAMAGKRLEQFKNANSRRWDREATENPPKSAKMTAVLPRDRQTLSDVTTREQHSENRFRNERRKTQRLEKRMNLLKDDHKASKAEIKCLQRVAKKSDLELKNTQEDHSRIVKTYETTISKSRETVKTMRKMNRALKARSDRAPGILKKAVQKSRLRSETIKLTQRGTYTPKARALARVIAHSGCARENVGKVMKDVGEFLGIKVKRSMSRRTVGRSILEGGIAAKVQLGFELTKAKGE